MKKDDDGNAYTFIGNNDRWKLTRLMNQFALGDETDYTLRIEDTETNQTVELTNDGHHGEEFLILELMNAVMNLRRADYV